MSLTCCIANASLPIQRCACRFVAFTAWTWFIQHNPKQQHSYICFFMLGKTLKIRWILFLLWCGLRFSYIIPSSSLALACISWCSVCIFTLGALHQSWFSHDEDWQTQNPEKWPQVGVSAWVGHRWKELISLILPWHTAEPPKQVGDWSDMMFQKSGCSYFAKKITPSRAETHQAHWRKKLGQFTNVYLFCSLRAKRLRSKGTAEWVSHTSCYTLYLLSFTEHDWLGGICCSL